MTDMKKYANLVLDGERALYGVAFAKVIGCEFKGEADGESCLKETSDLIVENCAFHLRYPIWHTTNSTIKNCEFFAGARAPLWYGKNVSLANCTFTCVKAVRECCGVKIENCNVDSEEFGWKSADLLVKNSKINGFYAFFESSDITLENVDFSGKYSFQYVRNGTFKNCRFDTKDAFWHTENVIVYDSVVRGEYLGWYSKNLTLVNCTIEGTQPLCYAENLTLNNCRMIGCDLSFENSTVNAGVIGAIDSVKNAIGSIRADSIGEIIADKHSRGECKFTVNN